MSVLPLLLLLQLAVPQSLATLAMDEALSVEKRDPPTIPVFLQQTYKTVSEIGLDWETYPYDHEFTKRMFIEGAPSGEEVGIVISLSLAFILLRHFSEPRLRKLLQWAEFQPKDTEKAPEGIFRSAYYCIITVYGAYVSYFSGRYNFIQQPCEVYDQNITSGNYFTRPIPSDILSLYLIQFSYYLSGVYLELYMDKRRKDSTLMLLHHFVTLALMYFSYMGRYLKHGCIIFFLNDISDAILETGKICLYINHRGGIQRPFGELCCNAIFFFFTISWFYFRIYLYCVRLLHATNWCVYLLRDHWLPRMYLFFNGLLWTLFVMQLIWSYYILSMCIRLVTGKDKMIEDIREKEIEQSNGPFKNGISTAKKEK
ncbi:lag1 longevity assurance 1 [Echinococcus multilocularis]|uniref:Lag1 longevity assurance 1 n=1 Tax=Echinococcus multilocularis TaxID=6211 RepID=A0A068Y064_ECHMU|nr:lag1 longevity assurance 1 [Echinococcus multilocularis]